jgi:hypothetical protein
MEGKMQPYHTYTSNECGEWCKAYLNGECLRLKR